MHIAASESSHRTFPHFPFAGWLQNPIQQNRQLWRLECAGHRYEFHHIDQQEMRNHQHRMRHVAGLHGGQSQVHGVEKRHQDHGRRTGPVRRDEQGEQGGDQEDGNARPADALSDTGGECCELCVRMS